MTVIAQTIIDRAARQLVDQTNVVWPRSELLDWLSVGQRLVVTLQPSATNTIAVVPLAVGTRQTLPADGWMLLDVIRNMGASGTTPGRAIRVVSRKLLDAFNPTWHSDPKSATIQNYVYDQQDQLAFLVYPPANGNSYVEINYSALPAHLTSESDPIAVPDSYEEALGHYVMFRALSKNAGFAASPQADLYLQLFNSVLGGKLTAEQANNPNLGLMPGPSAALGGTS